MFGYLLAQASWTDIYSVQESLIEGFDSSDIMESVVECEWPEWMRLVDVCTSPMAEFMHKHSTGFGTEASATMMVSPLLDTKNQARICINRFRASALRDSLEPDSCTAPASEFPTSLVFTNTTSEGLQNGVDSADVWVTLCPLPIL